MSEPGSTNPIAFNNCISVKAAAFHSGYNVQYLRRLLRFGKLTGLKIGQVWLIDKADFKAHLDKASQASDRRFEPKY